MSSFTVWNCRIWELVVATLFLHMRGGSSYIVSPPAFSNDGKYLLVCMANIVSIFSTSTALQVFLQFPFVLQDFVLLLDHLARWLHSLLGFLRSEVDIVIEDRELYVYNTCSSLLLFCLSGSVHIIWRLRREFIYIVFSLL